MKIGILTTHPIQYQVPWFRALSLREDIEITVFYCLLPDEKQQSIGFNTEFKWDIPLLDGYNFEVLENVSKNAGVYNFSGCDTPSIWSVVRDGRFDAFIVNGWVVKSCIQLLFACRFYGVPCIVRGEANNLRRRAWYKKLVHKFLLRQYSAYLYIGSGNKKFYENNGVNRDKMFYAPYCVENKRFAEFVAGHSQNRVKWRRDWGIEDDRITFLFCGKFERKKRPLDILFAASEVRRRNPNCMFHLLMVGSGDLYDDARRMATKENLPITFCGFLNQSQIAQAYVSADVQVLPSDNGETWGLVVNEGMACGLPAIVSDEVGCHPDLVSHGLTGSIFPMGDIEKLTEAMLRYIDDPARVRREGEEAYKRVSFYNYDVIVEGTLDAVRAVTSR
jgi:glycosyltransferase involved in cell wall biosynthesis